MSLSINTSLSALNALATQQDVTANNIANSESKQFKKSTTVLETGANGTVTAKTQRVNTPGAVINQPDGSQEELSNVDLGQEITSMLPTKHAYEANLKVLKTSQEMEDQVLNLIG